MNRANNVTVACCQVAPKIGDLAYNRTLTERVIRQAASAGAQIVVLPELVQSGYLFHDRSEALSLSEPTDGPAINLWKALSKELNILIVAGFCERLGADQLANSAAMIDAQGLRAVYRKAHLWDEENAIFSAGNAPPPVVETAFGRISMMICYDLELPEWVRLAALARADLLCAPVNWPDGPRPVDGDAGIGGIEDRQISENKRGGDIGFMGMNPHAAIAAVNIAITAGADELVVLDADRAREGNGTMARTDQQSSARLNRVLHQVAANLVVVPAVEPDTVGVPGGLDCVVYKSVALAGFHGRPTPGGRP